MIMNNDAQVLKCRQLLSLCRDVLASPTNNDKAFVDIVISVEYWKQNKLQPLCEKLGMEVITPFSYVAIKKFIAIMNQTNIVL